MYKQSRDPKVVVPPPKRTEGLTTTTKPYKIPPKQLPPPATNPGNGYPIGTNPRNDYPIGTKAPAPATPPPPAKPINKLAYLEGYLCKQAGLKSTTPMQYKQRR